MAKNLPVPLARLEVLDWFRGLALLGMFVVHFHVRSTEPGGFDEVVRLLTWRLVESKSHGTFALLFGAGFALLLRRADASGQSITGRYLRRLAAPDILRRSQLVSSAGRMALTNYLLQIAALDLLFSGYALGLGAIAFGVVSWLAARPVIGVGAALVCFLAEAVFSALWLRHFQFGPAEWLWRSITYGRRQPIRRQSPALAA